MKSVSTNKMPHSVYLQFDVTVLFLLRIWIIMVKFVLLLLRVQIYLKYVIVCINKVTCISLINWRRLTRTSDNDALIHNFNAKILRVSSPVHDLKDIWLYDLRESVNMTRGNNLFMFVIHEYSVDSVNFCFIPLSKLFFHVLCLK